MITETAQTIPQAFVWRRLHSLTGLWLVIFLFFHLLTNSQAALFLGDDGSGFVRSVNSIHDLPYLSIIEILFLGFPIFIHAIWGIKYLFTSKFNSFGDTGKDPYLPEYSRNRAYTWQRITSWLLVVGILAHIIHMRFLEYPLSAPHGNENAYMVRVSLDEGLYPLAARLNVKLYDHRQIEMKHAEASSSSQSQGVYSSFIDSISGIFKKNPEEVKKEKPQQLVAEQQKQHDRLWQEALQKRPLKDDEAMAVANNFGTAELLMVRDTFKKPSMLVLYTLLVIATCFHAFNGLWTFMITWGITLTQRSQLMMLRFSTALMVIVSLMGLSAIWLTYWINLKQ